MFKHFDELEDAVHGLAERYQRTVAERNDLQKLVTTRNETICALETELAERNTQKGEVGKRIDRLIEEIDHLGEQLQCSGE